MHFVVDSGLSFRPPVTNRMLSYIASPATKNYFKAIVAERSDPLRQWFKIWPCLKINEHNLVLSMNET